MADIKKTYEEGDIQTLEGLEAVRKRPGMYIGGTGQAGFSHLLWELIDNSVDEASAGFCKKIDVTLHKDGSYEVADTGRGIPPGKQAGKKVTALEVVFTELHAGGKFGGGAYEASGGLHGVGASVVNALSEKMAVEVDRNGKTHRLEFQERIAGHRTGGKFKASHDLNVKPKSKNNAASGTRVRYWPDREIFDADVEIVFREVCDRLRMACYLIPGLKVTAVDKREGNSHEPFVFHSKKGLADYVDHLASTVGTEGQQELGANTDPPSQVTRTLTFSDSKIFEENVATKDSTKTVERTCEVEISLKWVDSYDSKVESFVNTIPTPEGGTHLAGFDRAILRVVNEHLIADASKLSKLAKSGNAKSIKDDVYEGLVAAIRVSFPEPQFQGQTKRELGTPAIQNIVYNATKQFLTDWVKKSGPRSHVNALQNKIINAILGRFSAKQALETKRKASKVGSAGMPDKLADCREPGEDSELIIVEGESAAGPAKAGRDARKVAVLPLRGKVINAAKATTKQVLGNAEAASLFTAMGAGIGDDFDLSASRYERVVILCDADVDGSHIRCLLLTLFYRYMRPMLDAGRIYVAQPPLFTTRAGDRIIRAFSEEERDEETSKLIKGGRKLENIRWQRFKGLGEMNVDELAECSLNPETRMLRQVDMEEAEFADEVAKMFDVLMGTDAEVRREYLVSNSELYDLDSLDV